MRFIWSLPALLAAAAMATASPCGVVYHQPYVQHSAVYHNDYQVEKKRVVVLEYQLIPSYPIGLAAPYTAPAMPAPAVTAPTPCDSKIAELNAKLAALEARLRGVPPNPGTPPGTLPLVTDQPSRTPTLHQHCAGCHAPATANKGKGLTLFSDKGDLLKLDDKTYGAVLRVLSDGTMPKDHKIDGDVFTKCLQELVNVHSK